MLSRELSSQSPFIRRAGGHHKLPKTRTGSSYTDASDTCDTCAARRPTAAQTSAVYRSTARDEVQQHRTAQIQLLRKRYAYSIDFGRIGDVRLIPLRLGLGRSITVDSIAGLLRGPIGIVSLHMPTGIGHRGSRLTVSPMMFYGGMPLLTYSENKNKSRCSNDSSFED